MQTNSAIGPKNGERSDSTGSYEKECITTALFLCVVAP